MLLVFSLTDAEGTSFSYFFETAAVGVTDLNALKLEVLSGA